MTGMLLYSYLWMQRVRRNNKEHGKYVLKAGRSSEQDGNIPDRSLRGTGVAIRFSQPLQRQR
jgi:hypothetical protein